MHLLLICCLFAMSFASCPSGTEYDSTFNRCYKFVPEPLAFFLAEQNCISVGGHLGSIQNGFENALVAETAGNTPGMQNSNFWIGANLLINPTNWSWSDGVPFSYSNWAPGEPNNTNQCATANAAMGIWRSTPCGQAMPYMCVIPGDVPTSPPPCPTQGPLPGRCQSGWTYYDQTDSCYKVLLQDNWENAEATCVAANSHLVSLHSDAENTFVADLAATGMTLDWDYMIWTGMHRVNNNWQYTDGSPVDYYHWAPHEPDNSGGVENCVQMLPDELSGKGHDGYRTGWNDIKCTDTMRAFVCKRSAIH